MRIPGLATGMDTDSIVKDMMIPYRVKIDRVQQDRLIVKYKQELYRDFMKEAQGFHNKYFDLNNKDSIMLSSNWETIGFTSSDEFAVSAVGTAGAKADNYKVKVTTLASKAETTIKTEELKNLVEGDKITLKMNGETVEINAFEDGKALTSDEIVKKLNEGFKEKGIKVNAEYSQFSNGIKIKTDEMGSGVDFELNVGSKKIETVPGANAEITIRNSSGEKYEYKGNTNELMLDGVKFKFNDVTGDKEITLIGKNDTTKIKDTIVGFVNDYNKLIEKTNKLVSEKNDKSYKPLTPEQKKEMTKEEIELWEKKAKTGLLRNDSDLNRIGNKLKESMRTLMGGLNLEKIGITPVQEYGNKNGMFTIDEKKLTEALEKNPEEVKDLFIKPSSDKDGEKNPGGIMVQMKEILFKETVSVEASLMKKAGMEGSVTSFNNALSKQLSEKEKMIDKMERDFKRRETNCYSKWARLEKQMNALNSQSSYLMQQFGGGM